MHPILRNILAVVAGLLLGSAANSLIIQIENMLIPAPEGVDMSSMESLKASMHLFEAEHFIIPWFAHALGSLTGSFVAVKLGTGRRIILAIVVGALFFAAGLTMVINLGGPIGFIAADLGLAYFPMAWLGYRLAGGAGPSPTRG